MEMAATDWDRERYLTLDQLLYAKALDVAEANNFGFIWTGFIDGLSGKYDRVTMERFWPQHPIFAEGNWSYDEMKDQHTHGTVDENVAGAVDWHSNFFHLYFGPRPLQARNARGPTSLEACARARWTRIPAGSNFSQLACPVAGRAPAGRAPKLDQPQCRAPLCRSSL